MLLSIIITAAEAAAVELGFVSAGREGSGAAATAAAVELGFLSIMFLPG
jgi:hypothetical protein